MQSPQVEHLFKTSESRQAARHDSTKILLISVDLRVPIQGIHEFYQQYYLFLQDVSNSYLPNFSWDTLTYPSFKFSDIFKASGGNRTHNNSLEGYGFTTKLRSQNARNQITFLIIIAYLHPFASGIEIDRQS
jgi:hypothetical protein